MAREAKRASPRRACSKEAPLELMDVQCPLHDEPTELEALFSVVPNNWAQKLSLQVVRCTKCGLVFFSPNVAPEARRAYHSRDYFIAPAQGCVGYPDYVEEGHLGAKLYFGKLVMSWFTRLWAGRDRRPTSILELGCATGSMLVPFQQKKWRAVGIDFAAWGIQWGQEHYPGLDLRCQDMDALELGDGELFDCMLLWDALEHSQRPREVLRALHEHSSDEATMIIQAPNVEAYVADVNHNYWSLYQHCFHYSPETLGRLLELEGWKIARKLPSSQPGEMLFVVGRS